MPAAAPDLHEGQVPVFSLDLQERHTDTDQPLLNVLEDRAWMEPL